MRIIIEPHPQSKPLDEMTLPEVEKRLRNRAKAEVNSWRLEGIDLNEDQVFKEMLESHMERREQLVS